MLALLIHATAPLTVFDKGDFQKKIGREMLNLNQYVKQLQGLFSRDSDLTYSNVH